MATFFAQGDILLERVDDVSYSPGKKLASATPEQPLVIAEGEFSGHCHAIRENADLFRDENRAWDIPRDLYIGHLLVKAPSAQLEHQEHGAITLLQGTYRVRRQRELDPHRARIVAD